MVTHHQPTYDNDKNLTLFSLIQDGVEEGGGHVDKDCIKDAGDEKKAAVKHEMGDKLDTLMSTMMVYIKESCFKNGK